MGLFSAGGPYEKGLMVKKKELRWTTGENNWWRWSLPVSTWSGFLPDKEDGKGEKFFKIIYNILWVKEENAGLQRSWYGRSPVQITTHRFGWGRWKRLTVSTQSVIKHNTTIKTDFWPCEINPPRLVTTKRPYKLAHRNVSCMVTYCMQYCEYGESGHMVQKMIPRTVSKLICQWLNKVTGKTVNWSKYQQLCDIFMSKPKTLLVKKNLQKNKVVSSFFCLFCSYKCPGNLYIEIERKRKKGVKGRQKKAYIYSEFFPQGSKQTQTSEALPLSISQNFVKKYLILASPAQRSHGH